MGDINEYMQPIREVIAMATGLKLNRVIVANQAGGTPRGNCCFVSLVPVKTIGTPRIFKEDVDAVDCNIDGWQDSNVTLLQKTMINASCNFFGDKANVHASQLMKCNYKQSIYEHLMRHEIRWGRTSEPRNLTALVNAKYQSRYQIDVEIVVDVPDFVEVVLNAHAVEVTYEDEQGQPFKTVAAPES